ncbi:MAG TPA: DNA translocase FtsK [Chitinophagales bacterium]|nr:DNA translocase FtsK [Chitinophagales bacterium]
MAKQKTTLNKNTATENELPPFFTISRIKRFSGVFLILLSIILLIAFISYGFSWKEDQGNVVDPSWKIFWSQDENVHNLMGRLGAFLSHFFIYNLFGIGAFIIPYLIFAFGVNITFSKRLFPLLKIVLNTALGLLIIPIFAKFIFPNIDFPIGGGMGKMLYLWLSTFIGILGLGIVLFGGLTSYFIWKFRKSIYTAWKNYQVRAEKERLERIEKEKIGGESIIPEEKPMPTPHFEDDTFEILKEESEEVIEDEEEMSPYAEPEKIVFETKIKHPKEKVEAEAQEEKVGFSIEENTELNENEFVYNDDLPKKKTVSKSTDEVPTLELEEPIIEEKAAEPTSLGNIATPYDHTLELSRFKFPPIDLLYDHGNGEISIDKEDLENKKNQIVETLLNYNISIDKIKATVGPTVTLYEIVPSPGIRISKIKNLEDDIALSLAALGIRIIAPIPGKGTIGIEVPNIKKAIVSMKSMIASEKFRNADMDLPVAIGKTITNEYFIADLAKMPHLLMAGATGQGKSVGLNALLVSLLYKKHPTELKFVLVDPKKVELTLFKKIEKYYLAKLPNEEEAIITDTKKVINTLNALCIEMDQRYDLLKAAMVRNIKEYNQKIKDRKLNPANGHRYLPYIVLVVDEFADLMMTAGKEVEMPIARLAQLARAIGIHLVIATQRPSVNIITGVIKANFPGRIAFKVASKIDSRTILDSGGADQLIGRGDLLLSLNSDIVRLQCPFVDTPEVEAIANFIEDQDLPCETYELPEYIDPKDKSNDSYDDDLLFDRDALFEDAARLIVLNQVGSTSLIQRKMSLGYNRAGRLMDQLEAVNIVGPNLGSKAREVLIKSVDELEQILQGLN